MAAHIPDTPLTTKKLGRRGFLVTAAKGLSLAFILPEVGRNFTIRAASPPGPTPKDLANAYIHIGADGSISLSFGGCEMGQGSMSGLSQILAEELKVDWNQIVVQQSLADPIVSYFTGGSSAVSGQYATLRTAGAAARELLVAAAIVTNGDPNRNNYNAVSATVVYTNPSTKATTTWTYASLATLAGSQTVPSDLRLTDPSQFKLIGQPVARVDIPAKTNGSAKYGIDTWSKDMVFAAIKHCPTTGGTLAHTPPKPAGAIAVVPCVASDSRGIVAAGSVNAVAVVASNTWLAFNLADGLAAKWNLPADTSSVDSAAILAQARQLMATGQALIAEPVPPAGFTPSTYAPVIEAQVAAALGTPTVDATYTLPHLAHATMEVMNCSVKITFSGNAPRSCEIWAPNQAAPLVASTASTVTGLPTSQIIVHTTYLGGGLGRKFEQDYISQAVQVAMAVKKPVKLTWKREEDFTHDQYRPMALIEAKATVNAGVITAWSYRNVSQSILGQRGWLPPDSVDSQAVEGAVSTVYNLGTHLVEWVPLPAGIPVGFWRSVGNSINSFATECLMDELAQAAGIDPFTFRYNNILDPRARAVLAAADTLSSWRHSLPTGHMWGLAIAQCFGSYVCEVVDVSQPTTKSVSVHRVACVVDCGTVINPDSVEAQMQGGIAHGLNAAIWGQTTFKAGVAQQRNFDHYRVMRIGEMPQITVEVLTTNNPPSGIGEPGVPPIAPAVANALSRLAGKRVRSLPLFPGATMGGL